jgi:predicted thioesterase
LINSSEDIHDIWDDFMPLPNASTTLSREVSVSDLASSFADSPGESYPEVLCSPAMLSLMERACADLLKGDAAPDHLSVGVSTKFEHLAPTALGETITATATFSRQERHLFWFDVSVSDASGIVGRGSHARALVSRETIEQTARKRAHH